MTTSKEPESDAKPELPKRLLDHVRTGDCVLFLGAGASVDSGAPLAPKLAREMAEAFLGGEGAEFPLSEVVALIDAEDGRRRLNEWLLKRLGSLEPSADLMQLPRFRWK